MNTGLGCRTLQRDAFKFRGRFVIGPRLPWLYPVALKGTMPNRLSIMLQREVVDAPSLEINLAWKGLLSSFAGNDVTAVCQGLHDKRC